jgi:hypothetical protein
MMMQRKSLSGKLMIRAGAVTVFLGLLAGGVALPVDVRAQGAAADPRQTDAEYQRSQRLFGSIRDVLEDAAAARSDARGEAGVGTIIARPFGLDAESRANDLLADAFSVVSDAPVTQIQGEIKRRREAISDLKDRVSRLREDRISAPVEATGVTGTITSTIGLTRTRADLDEAIADATARIAGNEMAIRDAKERFRAAMAETGATISPEEADLLLDSVTGNDLVRIAAAYEAARGVSRQLRDLMDDSGEDLKRAKRYYAMHTALLALLVHAQGSFIEKVDREYLPKLAAIRSDVIETRRDTETLLSEPNTARQTEALVSNLNAQDIALQAADFYRNHLIEQRNQIVGARQKTVRELRIADNTLRTVDASFQLRAMMESATLSFEALQNLESPGIERIFRNEQLRQEFQKLSERLAPGS